MPTYIDNTRQKIVTFVTERQTTIASGLAALLIIVVGFLIFNFFSRINKDTTPQNQAVTEDATSSSFLANDDQKKEEPNSPAGSEEKKDSGQVTNQAATSTSAQQYTVVRGDSLSKIAKQFYNDSSKWTEISKANNLTNPRLIHAGNRLIIPKSDSGTVAAAPSGTASTTTLSKPSGGNVTYVVRSGDTLWEIAQNFYGSGFDWRRIRDANQDKVKTLANGRALIVSGQHLTIP